jgi:hypothetical protein
MIPVLYAQSTMLLGASAKKISMQLHAIQDTILVQVVVHHAQLFTLIAQLVMLILIVLNAIQDSSLIAITVALVAHLIV